MRHTMVPEPPGFGDLPPAEKILYVQALWDKIVDSGEEIPVLESHLELAEQRLADYRRAPEKARSAYDVLEELTKESE